MRNISQRQGERPPCWLLCLSRRVWDARGPTGLGPTSILERLRESAREAAARASRGWLCVDQYCEKSIQHTILLFFWRAHTLRTDRESPHLAAPSLDCANGLLPAARIADVVRPSYRCHLVLPASLAGGHHSAEDAPSAGVSPQINPTGHGACSTPPPPRMIVLFSFHLLSEPATPQCPAPTTAQGHAPIAIAPIGRRAAAAPIVKLLLLLLPLCFFWR